MPTSLIIVDDFPGPTDALQPAAAPWLRRTADPAFGDRMENGRLVYLMFFAAA